MVEDSEETTRGEGEHDGEHEGEPEEPDEPSGDEPEEPRGSDDSGDRRAEFGEPPRREAGEESSEPERDESESSQRESTQSRDELVWFLVDRSRLQGGVETVAARLESEGVETEVVTITEVLGSAAREAVAGGAERILRGLQIAWQNDSGQEDFLRAIRREQPDLLVVTSPRYTRPLSLLESLTAISAAQIALPLDFNFGAAWLNGTVDAFVVPDESAYRRVADAEYDEDRIFRAGPPVLPNFEAEVDRDATREELGFGEEKTVLVRAESFDATTLDRIVFQATLVEDDVRFVFHHNGDGAVSQTLRRSADQHGLPAAMFGRVPDLERYITASDVVLAAPLDPYLPEIVRCETPLYLVGSDEGWDHQVDVLTRAYGAEYLADVLRLGGELEEFLDGETLEQVASRIEEAELAPGNAGVADALRTALGRVEEWKAERPVSRPGGSGEPSPSESGSPGDRDGEAGSRGPFESIGTGETRARREGGSAEPRGRLEAADDVERARPSLSRAEAKDQLAELILDERELERRLSELEREQERWRNRLDLARDWGEDDLAEEAEEILREYIDDASAARDELEDVRRQKEKLKRAARGGEASAPRESERRSAGPVDDPERAAEIEERFEEMELERDLDDLRDRVEGELGE